MKQRRIVEKTVVERGAPVIGLDGSASPGPIVSVRETTLEPPTLILGPADQADLRDLVVRSALTDTIDAQQTLLEECRTALDAVTEHILSTGAQAREIVMALSRRVLVLERTLAAVDRAIQGDTVATMLLSSLEPILAQFRKPAAP